MREVRTNEVRKAPRYRIELGVELPRGTGITRDVSTAGAYFLTDQPWNAGTPIDFTLLFHDPLQGPFRIRCHGTVVRVEAGPTKAGIAATIQSSAFGGS